MSVCRPFFAVCLLTVVCVWGVRGLPRIQINEGGWFVEKDTGRVRIFHGTNAVLKEFPWYPENLLNDTVLDLYKEWGFTAVRLGTMWSGAFPVSDKVNSSYIEIIQTIVQKLEQRGIYVFLDMHQDVLGKKFGTYNGAPGWLLDKLPASRHEFPWPFESLSQWAEGYLAEATGQAFQEIYNNVNGGRDALITFWQTIAKNFKNSTSVLGYELINEPWAGDVYADPLLILPGEAGSENLGPLYDILNDEIRKIDTETIIMYEPVTFGVLLNGNITGTGFAHVPGGDSFRNRSALSYHYYCWVLTTDMHKPYPIIQRMVCDALWATSLFNTVIKDVARLGGGAFLTEFGECVPDGIRNSTDTVECETVMELADQNLHSWTYWDAVFFDNKGHVLIPSAKAFGRPYPKATAGTPLYINFDVDKSIFTYIFLADPSIEAPTELHISTLIYPKGFNVITESSITYTYDKDSNTLSISLKGVKKPENISISVVPKKSYS